MAVPRKRQYYWTGNGL